MIVRDGRKPVAATIMSNSLDSPSSKRTVRPFTDLIPRSGMIRPQEIKNLKPRSLFAHDCITFSLFGIHRGTPLPPPPQVKPVKPLTASLTATKRSSEFPMSSRAAWLKRMSAGASIPEWRS